MPLLSVIIPVYNATPFLRDCLNSVRKQSFSDWECICVDDGSTDRTPDILDEYAKMDSRFRVVRREHSNAGACRNAGMDASSGDFLLFLDSDDVFSRRMFKCLFESSLKTGADIVSCRYAVFQDGATPPWLHRPRPWRLKKTVLNPADSVDIYRTWIGWAWDKLFKRSHVESLGLRFQEIAATNDARFVYSALATARKATMIPDRLIAHRRRNGSVETTRGQNPLCVLEAVSSSYDELSANGAFVEHPHLLDHFRRWAGHMILWYLDTMGDENGQRVLLEAAPPCIFRLNLAIPSPSFNETDRLECERLACIAARSPMGEH